MIAMHPRALGRSRTGWLTMLLLGPACNPPLNPTSSASTTGLDTTTTAEPTSQTTLPGTTGDEPPSTSVPTSAGGQSGSGGGSGATTTSTSDPTGEPMCGDGVQDTDEECEPVMPGMNDCHCYAQTCRRPKCGNKIVELCEECDLGAGNGIIQYNGCFATGGDDTGIYDTGEPCTLMAHCGDGHIDAPDEFCESSGSEGCMDCKWLRRIVFVTKKKFQGDLGGLDGANLKCREAAKAAGLDNYETYRAWLSDHETSPLTSFKSKDVENAPYVRLGDKMEVAKDFASLVAKGPVYPIEYDENGALIDDGQVWTNTLASGKVANNAAHCNDWKSAEDSWKGWPGYPKQGGKAWTEGAMTPQDCNMPARLYCFQDAP